VTGLDPTVAGPRAALARAGELLRLNRPAEALAAASAVLAGQPGSPEALRLVARCHTALGNHQPAIETARAAVAADPDSEYGYRVLGRALTEAGQHWPASDAARQAVRLAPQEWRAHWLLGITLRHFDPVQAMSAAARARELAPDVPDTHVLCGLIHQRLRQPDAARSAYLRALSIDPENSAAHNNLAVLDGARRRWGSALRGFRTALRIDPQQSLARENIAGTLASVARTLAATATVCALVVTFAADRADGLALRVLGGCLVAGLLTAAGAAARIARRDAGPFAYHLMRTDSRLLISEGWFSVLVIYIVLGSIVQLFSLRDAAGRLGDGPGILLVLVTVYNLSQISARGRRAAKRRSQRKQQG
jgi:tetratricopeptide (TPR) repeat protein